MYREFNGCARHLPLAWPRGGGRCHEASIQGIGKEEMCSQSFAPALSSAQLPQRQCQPRSLAHRAALLGLLAQPRNLNCAIFVQRTGAFSGGAQTAGFPDGLLNPSPLSCHHFLLNLACLLRLFPENFFFFLPPARSGNSLYFTPAVHSSHWARVILPCLSRSLNLRHCAFDRIGISQGP